MMQHYMIYIPNQEALRVNRVDPDEYTYFGFTLPIFIYHKHVDITPLGALDVYEFFIKNVTGVWEPSPSMHSIVTHNTKTKRGLKYAASSTSEVLNFFHLPKNENDELETLMFTLIL